jgi:subtilisin family serine protease
MPPQADDWQADLPQEVIDEIAHIKAEFAEHGGGIKIGVARRDDTVDYLYAEDQILVRDEFLERVLEIIEPDTVFREARDDPGRVHRIIAGVVRLRLRAEHRSVPDLLDDVDRQLGAGAATPDHLLTVAGGHGGVCPATEPRPVDFGTEPYPSVCPGRGGEGVLIYMDDTGLLREIDDGLWLETHPWLAHGVRIEDPAEDFDPRDNPLQGNPPSIPAYTGHGTFVAGVARCMAPAAEIIVTNVFKVAGSELESNWVPRLVAALGRHVDIFHVTIAAHSRRDLPLVAFGEWLRHVREHTSAVCVVAAGNDGSPRRAWPAAMPGVISVGALGGDWRGRALFSNYGSWVDVYAPGRDLINAYATGTYECQWFPYGGPHGQNPPDTRQFYGMARWSGTSFSTPIVTGLIAARMSRTGHSAQHAAADLLAEARDQAIPGVGPVLLPCCDPGHQPPAKCGGCGCCNHHHRC